jgi:hypothetical protein
MGMSNIQHYTKTNIQVKEQCFYFCSAFHNHSSVFNNEQNSHPNLSVKRPLAYSWEVPFTSADKCYIGAIFPTLRSTIAGFETPFSISSIPKSVKETKAER